MLGFAFASSNKILLTFGINLNSFSLANNDFEPLMTFSPFGFSPCLDTRRPLQIVAGTLTDTPFGPATGPWWLRRTGSSRNTRQRRYERTTVGNDFRSSWTKTSFSRLPSVGNSFFRWYRYFFDCAVHQELRAQTSFYRYGTFD